MQINNNNYSIAEVRDMVDRRELIINREYQRGSGLWPNGARGYFIDTIISNYPFPKIYFFEHLDVNARKVRREIVDGQQRVTTIIDFIDNRFPIVGESEFAGSRFNDLPDDVQNSFLAYPVSVDVIRNASQANILQMFRRMNAYTLPLNEAEKRHSSYQGAFKWFVNELADHLNPFFLEFGVFSSRQIVRMADAELITDIVRAIEEGVVSTSPSDLRKIYDRYDSDFDLYDAYQAKIREAFDFITVNFAALRRTNLMKSYALHSLITALIYNKSGFKDAEVQLDTPPSGIFCRNPGHAAQELLAIAQAHEAMETEGPYREYIWGALGGTNRAPRRLARVSTILHALQRVA